MLSSEFRRQSILIMTAAVIVICLVASVAGCKNKDAEPGPNEVWIIGWNFIPNSITVPAGTTITWKNTTRDYHEVTSDTGLFNAKLDSGESFNFTFTDPGTYGYQDTATDPHQSGKVIVQ